MLKLYGLGLSGNVHKARLLLSFLGLEYEEISVNLLEGEHLQPPFLQLNPFGQIPVLADDDVVVPDAQAILVYLARKYGSNSDVEWLPLEPLPMAEVMRWLSTTAGEVRQGPESARLYHLFGMATVDIEQANKRADFILNQLNQHLSSREWLACGHPTIADLAVFPYVALAGDGKISLAPYSQVLSWIERVRQLPGFVSMQGL